MRSAPLWRRWASAPSACAQRGSEPLSVLRVDEAIVVPGPRPQTSELDLRDAVVGRMGSQVHGHHQALQPRIGAHQQGQRQILTRGVVVLHTRPQQDTVGASIEGSNGLGKEAAPRFDAATPATPGVLVIIPRDGEGRRAGECESAGGDGDPSQELATAAVLDHVRLPFDTAAPKGDSRFFSPPV